ncbi:unnamed protein product [Symbiodinium pilosum]|uniref:Acyltransferase 3 domain-containing protein n=1 Tax=Symbiodinium pilosum TaxID=2952 RepID=A0A812IZ57_SYMPI|nr:unnamed protein product [Symbiodinium pilosum]
MSAEAEAEAASPPPKPKKVRITAFDAIRFFLIAYIVCGHFITFAGPSPFAFKAISQINVVVGAFFALSGYVAAYTTTENAERAASPKLLGTPAPKWILQRVFGYFPLHLLVLLLFSPVFLYADVNFNGWPTALWHGFLSAGMLQAWFPMHAEVWNAPTWFLSALTFATAMLPFALPILAKQSKAELRRTGLFIFLVGLLPKLGYCYDHQAWGMLEGAMAPKALPNLAMFNMQRFNPFFALVEVLLGAVACRLVMLDGADGEEKAQQGDSAQDLRILVAPRCTCKFVQSWLVSRLQHMLRSSPGFVSVSMHETYNRWAPQLVPKLEDGAWQSAPKAPQLGRSWNDASRSLEAVALAAAADTTARIRAASTCSTRTPSGTGRRSVSAIDDSSPDKTVHYGAPWVAAVPLTPLWHAVPLLPQGPRADQVSPLRDRELQQARDLRAEREEADTLRRHKEELQFELADLRKRLSQAAGLLQHARKQTGEMSLSHVLQEEQQKSHVLAQESQQVRHQMEQLKVKFSSDVQRLEDACKQLEKDKAQLKKALRQREQGESSLRTQIQEEQQTRHDMVRERESLKHELRKMQQLQEKAGDSVTPLSSMQSSSSSSGSAMIEVDLTGELADYAYT